MSGNNILKWFDFRSQILYFDNDAATYENNTITFNKNLEVDKVINISGDLKIDLGGYKIIANNAKYAVFYVNNANETIENGEIVGAKGGGVTIDVVDSNVEIVNAKVVGGAGSDDNKNKDNIKNNFFILSPLILC